MAEDLTIQGGGSDATIVDANAADRVFEALGNPPSTLTLELSGLTLRNAIEPTSDTCDGLIELYGGSAICANAVDLNFTDVTVRDNVGSEAVLVLGSMTLDASTIRDNQATGVVVFLGNLAVSDSTISGNDATGVSVSGTASATFRNVTFSGNSGYAINAGGYCETGFPCDPPDVSLNNVTIASQAVGVFNVFVSIPGGEIGYAPITVANSVFANSFSDCDGELVSQGYNLFERLGTMCTVTGVTTGNVTDAPGFLGPLQDNGSTTETHAPPAINAGAPAAPGGGGGACEATDQRNVARPVGGRCDRGAPHAQRQRSLLERVLRFGRDREHAGRHEG